MMEHTLLDQISMFERKLSSCERVYVPHVLDRMLMSLSSRPAAATVQSIDTMQVLKALVKLEAERVDTIVKDPGYHENNLLVYFKWYFNFVAYITELRNKFEMKIWRVLHKHFHPYQRPNVPNERSMLGSRVSQESYSSSLNGSDPNRVRLKALAMLGDNYKTLEKAYDTSDVDIIIESVDSIMYQWKELLREDTVLSDQYVLDSYQSIDPSYRIRRCDSNCNIIHVLPLAMLLCKKAAAFAKDWIELYRKKRDTLKVHLHEVKKAENGIKTKLESVSEDLSKQVNQLQQEENELKQLLAREERSAALDGELYKLNQEVEVIESELAKYEKQEKHLLTLILSKKHITPQEIYELRQEYDKNHMKCEALTHIMQSKRYQRELITSDLEVEMFLKPSMVRFTNNVQEKCETLESTIGQRREQKQTLEQALELPTIISNPPLPLEGDQWTNSASEKQNRSRVNASVRLEMTKNGNHHEQARRTSVSDYLAIEKSIVGPPVPPKTQGTAIYIGTKKKQIKS